MGALADFEARAEAWAKHLEPDVEALRARIREAEDEGRKLAGQVDAYTHTHAAQVFAAANSLAGVVKLLDPAAAPEAAALITAAEKGVEVAEAWLARVAGNAAGI